jgi:hypothetical protein
MKALLSLRDILPAGLGIFAVGVPPISLKAESLLLFWAFVLILLTPPLQMLSGLMIPPIPLVTKGDLLSNFHHWRSMARLWRQQL